MKTKEISLIGLQEELIERLIQIEHQGQGDHRCRSRRAAMGKTVVKLMAAGFTREQARCAVFDASDMAKLRLACEGE